MMTQTITDMGQMLIRKVNSLDQVSQKYTKFKKAYMWMHITIFIKVHLKEKTCLHVNIARTHTQTHTSFIMESIAINSLF